MSHPTLTVFHTSDFQCGKPFRPDAAEALVRLSRRVQPDIVVVSGDLTQRAKVHEYEQARAVLDQFGDLPMVVTPGNHDVPLFRLWERVAAPYRNWRRFTGQQALDTATHVEGATIVALNSAAPHRAIVNGRVDSGQIDFARRAFSDADADDLRILVIHHHFVPVHGGEGGRPLPGAARLAEAFLEMGVDAVLGGHVHQLHLNTADRIPGCPDSAHVLPILASGTSASRRGRGGESGWNSLCVHSFMDDRVEVTPYLRGPEGEEFEAMDVVSFPLRRGLEAVS